MRALPPLLLRDYVEERKRKDTCISMFESKKEMKNREGESTSSY